MYGGKPVFDSHKYLLTLINRISALTPLLILGGAGGGKVLALDSVFYT